MKGRRLLKAVRSNRQNGTSSHGEGIEMSSSGIREARTRTVFSGDDSVAVKGTEIRFGDIRHAFRGFQAVQDPYGNRTRQIPRKFRPEDGTQDEGSRR